MKINFNRNRKIKIQDELKMLMPYIVSYFGTEYSDIIMDAYNRTKIYEWNSETENEIREELGDILNNSYDNKSGLFYKKITDPNMTNYIVINGNNSRYEKICDLVHEFVHAIISEIDPIIDINGLIYKRNGISRIGCNNNKKLHRLANEGFIEYITKEIIILYNPKIDFQRYCSKEYINTTRAANILFEVFGKEKLFDILVLNKESINYLYNPDDYTEFNKLSSDMEKDSEYIILLDLNNLFERLEKNNKYKERNDIDEGMLVR